MTANVSLLFGLFSLTVFAAQPYHTNLRMENIPPGEELVTFAIDGSGNVFTVGYVTNGFGQQQVRADKFDASGNALGARPSKAGWRLPKVGAGGGGKFSRSGHL